MKKLTLFIAAFMFAMFSFAQDSGQWSFGVGGDFTTPGGDANVGYFVMDGLMINASFNMSMDYENECLCEVGTDHAVEGISHDVEGAFDWGLGLRYYAVDNLFLEGSLSTGTGEDPDMSMGAGVSLELGFDGKLWFEPMVSFSIPGEEYGEASQNHFGLSWAFRYTF